MNKAKYKLEDCQECHRICLAMVNHCQKHGGPQVEMKHIRLLLDCAEICQTATDFLPRASALHLTICNACAVICLKCAADCEEFAEDELMQTCAAACRRAAAACQALVASATEQQAVYPYAVSLAASRTRVEAKERSWQI
jgi:hypothetical protein